MRDRPWPSRRTGRERDRRLQPYQRDVPPDGERSRSATRLDPMACEPAVKAQAQAFTAALTGATEWHQTETGDLELRGHGDIVATPGAPRRRPVRRSPASTCRHELGPRRPGRVGRIRRGPGARPSHSGPTGSPAGFAGCNTYSGTVHHRRHDDRHRSAREHQDRLRAAGERDRGGLSAGARRRRLVAGPADRPAHPDAGRPLADLRARLDACGSPTSASATRRPGAHGGWRPRSDRRRLAGSTWRRPVGGPSRADPALAHDRALLPAAGDDARRPSRRGLRVAALADLVEGFTARGRATTTAILDGAATRASGPPVLRAALGPRLLRLRGPRPDDVGAPRRRDPGGLVPAADLLLLERLGDPRPGRSGLGAARRARSWTTSWRSRPSSTRRPST